MSATHTQGPFHVVKHSWSDTSVVDESGKSLCLLRIPDDIDEDTQDECEREQAEIAAMFADSAAMRLALALIAAGVAELRLDPVVPTGTPGEYTCGPVLWIDGDFFIHRGTYTELLNAIGWDRARDALAQVVGQDAKS